MRYRALVTASAFFLVASCQDRNEYQPPPDAPVTVATPLSGEVIDVIETDGVITGLQEVEIRAQVQGTITAIHFEDGAQVEEGAPLFTIDPGPYRAAVQQARANVRTRRAAAEFARASLARATDLHDSGAMSDQQFDEVRQTNAGTIAQVAEAEAALQSAEINLQYTDVRAPIAGTLSRRLVDRGALVGAGEPTLLVSLVNSSSVYAEFTLSQNEALTLRERARARMRERGAEDIDQIEIPIFVRLADEEGFPHRGKLSSVENSLNSSTGTLSMRAVMENPGNTLYPGLFCRVRLPLGRVDGILVPEVALGLDQVGRFIYVVNEENEVERRNVVVAAQHQGNLVRIEEGIAADDRVIINGMVRARVGAHVEVTEGEIEAPANLYDPRQLEGIGDGAAGGDGEGGERGEGEPAGEDSPSEAAGDEGAPAAGTEGAAEAAGN